MKFGIKEAKHKNGNDFIFHLITEHEGEDAYVVIKARAIRYKD